MGAEMREFFVKLTSNGQVTVPIEVRRHLGLYPGDRICIAVGEDGYAQLRPAPLPTIESIRAAGSVPQQLGWDELLDHTHEDWMVRRFVQLE
jgi:AbrB family looped-hinge helix DNA binding protein